MRRLITAHPIGGCPLGEDYTSAVVNQWGQAYRPNGELHRGLYVADGAIIPTPVGANPFLTISALAEHIAEGIVRR